MSSGGHTGDQVTELSADMLAQARGCFPENECYYDCVEAAGRTINGDYLDHMTSAEKEQREAELRNALAWAKTQSWI
jgi:hypothetical protein